MKKLAALAGAGAMVLAVAAPAFANNWNWFGSSDSAYVYNTSEAVADTGGNTQGDAAIANKFSSAEVETERAWTGGRYMTTGAADADADAVVVANTHVGCFTCGNNSHDDKAFVGNDAKAGAFTGGNDQGDVASADWFSEAEVSTEKAGTGDRRMTTGAAESDSDAWVVVNTHWSGWTR